MDTQLFYETPRLDTRLWTLGFKFARTKYTVISTKQEGNMKSFYFFNDVTVCINAHLIQWYKKKNRVILPIMISG